MTIAWIETYKCGCQSAALKRSELLGYCGIHGSDKQERFKLPFDTKAEALAFVNADREE
jgi:hypothetical protein